MATPWRETTGPDGLPLWTREDGAVVKRVSSLPGRVWAGCRKLAENAYQAVEKPEFDSARNAMKAVDRAFPFHVRAEGRMGKDGLIDLQPTWAFSNLEPRQAAR